MKRAIAAIEADGELEANEPDSRQKSAQRLIEVKERLDLLEKASEWELLVADLREYGNSGQQLLSSVGTPAQQETLQRLLAEGDVAIQSHSVDDVRRIAEELRHLYWQTSFSQDGFWKGQFERLRDDSEYVDPLRAERLIEEGDRALKRDDIPSLRTIVWELFGLLPSWQQSKLDLRFENAGLRRAQGRT